MPATRCGPSRRFRDKLDAVFIGHTLPLFPMLPLSAEATPNSVSELAEAIRRGLQDQGLVPRQVDARGSELASVEALRIDVSETRLGREFRPPHTGEPGAQEVVIADFSLTGAPIYFEKTPIEIRVAATQVTAGMGVSNGRGSLLVKSAATGEVSVKAEKAALEELLQSFAAELAAKQGLEVRKTSLSFIQEGPRAVSFRAEVTAKVFVMSASLALTGRLEIDDQLNARLSNLALDGDGMILKLAGSYAKPHLDRLEGRVFPLLAFTPGGLKLHDMEITAGDSLLVRAQFGAA